jgi:hypothetical protein
MNYIFRKKECIQFYKVLRCYSITNSFIKFLGVTVLPTLKYTSSVHFYLTLKLKTGVHKNSFQNKSRNSYPFCFAVE